jgi:hypothetical protein
MIAVNMHLKRRKISASNDDDDDADGEEGELAERLKL